jgi:hypothetical protein
MGDVFFVLYRGGDDDDKEDSDSHDHPIPT